MTSSLVSNGGGFSYYFVIVGQADNPVYELEYSTKGGEKGAGVDHRYLSQFIGHAALDLVEELMWTTKNMYLGVVDKFNEWHVVAFVGASTRTKLLLIHDVKVDDSSLKSFFTEVYDLFSKFSLNPLFQHHTPIRSNVFDKKVQMIAKKFLP